MVRPLSGPFTEPPQTGRTVWPFCPALTVLCRTYRAMESHVHPFHPSGSGVYCGGGWPCFWLHSQHLIAVYCGSSNNKNKKYSRSVSNAWFLFQGTKQASQPASHCACVHTRRTHSEVRAAPPPSLNPFRLLFHDRCSRVPRLRVWTWWIILASCNPPDRDGPWELTDGSHCKMQIWSMIETNDRTNIPQTKQEATKFCGLSKSL